MARMAAADKAETAVAEGDASGEEQGPRAKESTGRLHTAPGGYPCDDGRGPPQRDAGQPETNTDGLP